MGETCSMHEECEKCLQNLSENLKGRGHVGDLGIDGRIIWKCVFKEVGYEGVYWIELVQDRQPL